MAAPMEPFRLRMKIGVHEFEAEGDQETVQLQFQAWRELITSQPTASSPPPSNPGAGAPYTVPGQDLAGNPILLSPADVPYDRVFRREGQVISLSVPPTGERREADAALLILAGQRQYNSLELVGSTWVMRGLQRSGINVPRVDRAFGDHMGELVIRVGQGRAVQYRLTNPGLTRANELIREMAARVA